MKVGVFLSTVSENPEKRKYLDGFYSGINRNRIDRCFLSKGNDYRECDLAIIFGFYGINMGNIHKARKHIYTEHTIKRKKNCIFVDADLFRFLGENTEDTTHVRVCYQSIFFDKSIHFNDNSDNSRWNLIKKRKGITVSDYREDGEHILICLNSNPYVGKGWSAGNVNIYDWAEKAIHEIRQETNRDIILRFHPNEKDEEQQKIPIKRFLLAGGPNTYFSGGVDVDHNNVIRKTSLQDDCKNAWACVVHNTSASTTPIINGIPVFTIEKTCPVYKIANHNLKHLNNPKLPDRTQWLNDTAYCLWNYHEIKSGIIWNRYRDYLNSKGDISAQKNQLRKQK